MTDAGGLRRFHERTLRRTAYAFDHLIRYNLAGVVVLREHGTIGPDAARRLVEALLAIGAAGVDALVPDPWLEDLQPHVERAVGEALGADVAGHLTTGRSRAEMEYCAEHLALRELMLDALSALASLDRILLEQASRHVDTVVPYYTCHQRAEPMTFGYYLAAFGEELRGHEARLTAAYRRFDLSPAGVGHIVPTARPLDRARLAELLGMARTVHHSLYGYFHVDIHIDALSALALAAATCSRLSLDLYLWSSSDIGIASFAPEFCSPSFVMPQKRNPTWLRVIRPAAMAVKLLHEEALDVFLHTTPMELGGVVDIPSMLQRALDELRMALDTTAGAMATIELDQRRGRELAGLDFSQAGEVVGALLDANDLSWRQAHGIVKDVVSESAQGKRFDDDAVRRLAGAAERRLGRPLDTPADGIREALDVERLVDGRVDSGPSPAAVRGALEDHGAAVAQVESYVARERERLAAVWSRLDALARTL